LDYWSDAALGKKKQNKNKCGTFVEATSKPSRWHKFYGVGEFFTGQETYGTLMVWAAQPLCGQLQVRAAARVSCGRQTFK